MVLEEVSSVLVEHKGRPVGSIRIFQEKDGAGGHTEIITTGELPDYGVVAQLLLSATLCCEGTFLHEALMPLLSMATTHLMHEAHKEGRLPVDDTSEAPF